ncbi:hypothetical protein [Floridanema evergladense]|uniref:Uncharacterized protein n=1 Tax=Floridaenema evergladense BLCC-F167 TaxID=3153639 RepID=A0ABV4WCX8_9CYAN
MGVTTVALLPKTTRFLIDYEVRLIQSEWLLGIRTAIRLNSVVKAQKIADVLGDELSKVCKELFIYERYQFHLLLKGESINKYAIPIDRFPNRRGKSLDYMRVEILEKVED